MSESNRLRERVKELTALHEVARALERTDTAMPALFEHIALLLVSALRYPADTVVRVSHGASTFETTGYRRTPWQLTAEFQTSDGRDGALEVGYLQEKPVQATGPFLAEERALLQTAAEMLRSHLERRTTEDQLRRSQEQLGVALSSVKMGFWEWDVLLNQMVWSEEMARLCGMTTKPPVARYRERFFLIHPDDTPRVTVTVRDAIGDPKRQTFEVDFRIQPPKGSQRWLLAKAHIFRDDMGRCVRVLGVVIDVTDRRRLQDQFLQAQKMQAVGQFASGVAHDFNNILSVIVAQCDRIGLADASPAVVHEGLEEISAAAIRAAHLTQQLLTFSRKGEASPQLVDPNDVIAQMSGLLRTLAGQHELRLVLDRNAGFTRVDPRHLEQAIMNLVVNARDAMPVSGVITVRTIASGDSVVISVSDTGTGMDDATRERIFEPFFTTKAPGEGTGLGLTVVLNVVEEAQGSIHVETAPGRGTTFDLRFPHAVT